MTMEEALDLWMIVLGMPNEDANPGSCPTAYQGNIISETFLGLNLRDRVTFLAGLTRVTTRVLEVVGGLVGLALSNERGQELVEVPVETAETGLMQTHLNHPHGDSDTPCLDDRWYKVLAELRETLEALNPEGRCAHSLLLLRLLDWRCTNAASGYILGHVHGRASDLLALLTVAHDDQKYEVDPWKPRDHQVMQDWRKLLDFLPESQGSRAAMGRPLGLGRSAWVQMSVPPGVTYTWGRRSTNLPAAILDAMVEEGEQRLEQPTSQEPVSSEQARVEEEQRYLEELVMAHEREAILEKQRVEGMQYQQWEDDVLRQEMTGHPRHHGRGLDSCSNSARAALMNHAASGK